MGKYIDLVNRLYGDKENKPPQDPHKDFHTLLIDTFREIDRYRFTDTPLTWAKEYGYTNISLAMFRAEINLNSAILEKHLEEAKYWAAKLVAGYKELYEAKNTLNRAGS